MSEFDGMQFTLVSKITEILANFFEPAENALERYEMEERLIAALIICLGRLRMCASPDRLKELDQFVVDEFAKMLLDTNDLLQKSALAAAEPPSELVH